MYSRLRLRCPHVTECVHAAAGSGLARRQQRGGTASANDGTGKPCCQGGGGGEGRSGGGDGGVTLAIAQGVQQVFR
jgi:hypothetical protein